jgi:HemY protein
MIRILVFLAFLIVAAFGLTWLADRPGEITLVWQGYQIETSLMVGLAVLAVAMIVIAIVWSILRFVLAIPSLVSIGARARQRRKGLVALSRGMIAAGAGDARAAKRASAEALRRLGEEPLTLLLEAEAAQLAGDRATAEATFARMAEMPDMRVLGLRGLHVEARRRGDAEAAYVYALQAHRIAPLAWAGNAVLDHHATHADWSRALVTVGENHAHKLVDTTTAARQRAVLLTALACSLEDRDPEEALRLAREAAKLAPDLVPAVVLAGRLLSRKGDIKRAARLLEDGWRRGPHPDIARAYLAIRPGDSAADRLLRAQTLDRLAPDHPEARMIVARAAIEARDFALARRSMAPLVETNAADSPPTVRMCLLMADLEETEHGATGAVRGWLARASRARRDPAWIADGIVCDSWAPASPVTGKLDAFVWRAPQERLSAPVESPPIAASPAAEPQGHAASATTEAPPHQIDFHAETVAAQPAAEFTAHSTLPTGKAAGLSARLAVPLAIAPDDPGPRPDPAQDRDSFT